MLCLERKKGGFQFGDTLGYKPELWGKGLAVCSISDVPDVGFVTVRLSVLDSSYLKRRENSILPGFKK